MFGNSILDALAGFGYLAAGFGFIACVIAYFAIPKLMKIALNSGDEDENS